MKVLLSLVLFLLASCNLSINHDAATESAKLSVDLKYSRKDWNHWKDADGNCINTRHEILKSRSKSKVIFNKKGCSVVSGLWDDYYYPEQHTQAKQVDIDHLVPLKHAHDHGGSRWSKEEKEIFANDDENLVITSKIYNQQKGSQAIDTWLPVNKEYACKYIKDWMKIKNKYKLVISEKENSSYRQLIQSCH